MAVVQSTGVQNGEKSMMSHPKVHKKMHGVRVATNYRHVKLIHSGRVSAVCEQDRQEDVQQHTSSLICFVTPALTVTVRVGEFISFASFRYFLVHFKRDSRLFTVKGMLGKPSQLLPVSHYLLR